MDELSDAYFLWAAGVWFGLQVMALRIMDGIWRLAAWLSASAMGLAVLATVVGLLAGSALAPMWIVFALPACLLWIVALWIAWTAAWFIEGPPG